MVAFCTSCNTNYIASVAPYALPCGHVYCASCITSPDRIGCSMCSWAFPDDVDRLDLALRLFVEIRNDTSTQTLRFIAQQRDQNARVAREYRAQLKWAKRLFGWTVVLGLIILWMGTVVAEEASKLIAEYRRNTTECILYANGTTNATELANYLLSHDLYRLQGGFLR